MARLDARERAASRTCPAPATTRSRRSRKRIAARSAASLLRRIPGHRRRRRDDPRPAVRAAVRDRVMVRADLEHRARAALRRRPEPPAFPALHRADRGASGSRGARRPTRLPAESLRGSRCLPDAARRRGRRGDGCGMAAPCGAPPAANPRHGPCHGPHACRAAGAAKGAARFTFDEFCGRPLGAGDYLRSRASITRCFSIVFRCWTRRWQTRRGGSRF